MDDLRRLSLADLVRAVATRAVSARELTVQCLERVELLNPTLNAFVAVDAEQALAGADAVDRRLASGAAPRPLEGVPLAVKDTEDVAGYRTTYGSALWEDAPIATTDSVLVARLTAAGCVVIGKTNTPELASKASTDNPVFGATANPWDVERTCGGSSGGSAAAVASGMVGLATGSDGGGSIRIPASACGLTGFKPSLGRVPDGGPRPVDWPAVTSRGVLAFDAAATVLAYDVVVGPHPTEPRSLPAPAQPWREAAAAPRLPARLGWSPTLGYATVDPEVQAVCERALAALATLGVEVVALPDVFDHDPVVEWATLIAVYNRRTLAPHAESAAWSRRDPQLVDFFDGLGAAVTAQQLVEAEDAAHHLHRRLHEVFERVDLLATPTLAALPPRLDAVPPDFVRHTYPFNLTRSPAGTVTAGFSASGLPVGLQLVGPQHADVEVLQALRAVEDALALDRVAPLPWAPRNPL